MVCESRLTSMLVIRGVRFWMTEPFEKEGRADDYQQK